MNNFTCTYTYILVNDTYPVIDASSCSYADPLVIATSTLSASVSIETSSSSPLNVISDISYSDWLFVNIWLIFLMSFISIGLIYSVFKPKK